MALFTAAGPVAGQTRDIVGVVRDSLNNETLPNVAVSVVERSTRVLTDEFGRFSLVGIPDGSYTLRFEYLGYRTTDVPVSSAERAALAVLLAPSAIELEGVTVQTSGEIAQVSEDVSQITISPRALSTMPSLGEADVFRTLQLLPGVSGTNDATSGLYIRGGTPDENLVLLDGMTVYHVDHFFGVFSAFNSDAIKDVRLFKGGFPAQFGGRTSSVVEMVGKSGDGENANFSAGLNLLSSRAVVEVPLFSQGSLLFSVRRSYTDILRTPLYNGIFNTVTGQDDASQAPGPGGGAFGGGFRGGPGNFQQQTIQPDFYFYDLNAKLTLTPTERDVLAVSLYSGEDQLDESSGGQQISLPGGQTQSTPDRVDVTTWGNRGLSGRWSRLWSSRLTTDVLVAGSEYFSRGALDVSASQLARGFQEDNEVHDLTLRLDNTWRPFQSSEVGFGAQLTRTEVGYSFSQLQGDSVRGVLDIGGEGRMAAAYLQDRWTPTDRLELTVGLRGSTYDRTSKVYLEPRASAQLHLTDQVRLKGAWGRYTQFVKRVENEDVLEGSRDFWVLAGDELPPASSEHRILGVAFETDTYLFDIEAYGKLLDGVSQFSTRARRSPDEALFDLFFSGTGHARGVEFLAQKKSGALTGWVGYTLANVEYKLTGFNDGLAFPASHDQRHELTTVASYQLGAWTLSGTWVFGSGKPYTLPEARYPIQTLDGQTLNYIHVGEKNGELLPAYHRLDLSAARRFESARFFYELNVSLFNAYGRNNVWYRQFDLTELPMLVTDVTTLGFTPSIGFRIGMR